MNATISRVENNHEFTQAGLQFTAPHYDIAADEQTVEISIIVPEVDEDGIEIILYQDQMVITARRNRVVRPNWEALRLECAQRDYRLHLGLGFVAHPESVRIELACGILSIRVERPTAIGV
jgi:HSP20 family molecular chaperone IbpA